MSTKKENVAKVQVVGGQEIVLPVTGKGKPEVSSIILEKWQNIADLAAKAINVPAGLIMQLHAEEIEVAVSSRTEGNPYKPEEREKLGLGLYCETVVGTRNILHVPNALDDDHWKNNPDIKLGMISYLGMPLKWSDGEIFGTICVLDDKAHLYSDTHIQLLGHFRNVVETDLHLLMERETLKRLNVEKELSLREAHHRIKNHLNMLSGMLQLSIYSLYNEGSEVEVSESLLEDLISRIRAIAELHSQIALAEHSQVDLSTFLETICRTVLDSLSDRDVGLNFVAESFDVSRRTFFHTGLLVSELLTNALKHAFEKQEDPEISITIKDGEDGMFSLMLKDNGNGLCTSIIPEKCESIGMMLISDLPNRMGGSYSIDTNDGTTYSFVLEKDSEIE